MPQASHAQTVKGTIFGIVAPKACFRWFNSKADACGFRSRLMKYMTGADFFRTTLLAAKSVTPKLTHAVARIGEYADRPEPPSKQGSESTTS